MTDVPVPFTRSRPLPGYHGLLAVDAKDFTGLPAIQHAAVSKVIPEFVDLALDKAGLTELRDAKRFPAGTGDGVVFGFDPVLLPFVLAPFLDVLDAELGRHNALGSGPRVRLRASVHIGPLPHEGDSGDGNGTARNDTHRLLDSRPVKAVLAASSEHTTHLAAIISDRVFEDVVLGGYAGLHPDRCIEVPATVEGKRFAQRAWLYVPSPSGNLFGAGVLPGTGPDTDTGTGPGDATTAGAERAPDAGATGTVPARQTRYEGNAQHVREGMAVMGDAGDLTWNGGSTTHDTTHNTGTNQHWGTGDNVSGTKNTGAPEERR